MGVATAALSRVTVTSQETSSELTWKIRGYSGSSGTTAVFSRDTVMPPSPMMAVTSQGGDLSALECA